MPTKGTASTTMIQASRIDGSIRERVSTRSTMAQTTA